MSKRIDNVTAQFQQISNEHGIPEFTLQGYGALYWYRPYASLLGNYAIIQNRMDVIIKALGPCTYDKPQFENSSLMYQSLKRLFSPKNSITASEEINPQERASRLEFFAKRLEIFTYNILTNGSLDIRILTNSSFEASIPNDSQRDQSAYITASRLAELFRTISANHNRGPVTDTIAYQIMKAAYTYSLSDHSKAFIDSLKSGTSTADINGYIKIVEAKFIQSQPR